MKYFLALALVAVAGAVSPQPVRLMERVLFKEPVFAPREVKAVPLPVKVVDAPEISEAAVEDVNAYDIKVVDEAVNADAVATVADLKSLLEPVQLEEAVYAPLMMPEEAKEAVMAVKVVDAPEISESAVEDVNAYDIKVVDEAVNADAVATVADLKSLLEPVQLEEAVYAPLMMPEEAKDAVMAVKVVDSPEISEAAVEDVNAYDIKVVDEAVNADAVATVADLKSLLEPVQLEEAVYAPLMMPEEARDTDVVDAPVPEAAEDTNAYAIKIVEEAVNDVEAPVVVNFNHAPLPDSFLLPLDVIVLPSIDPAMVLVEVDEESPSYVPLALRRYADATWR